MVMLPVHSEWTGEVYWANNSLAVTTRGHIIYEVGISSSDVSKTFVLEV